MKYHRYWHHYENGIRGEEEGVVARLMLHVETLQIQTETNRPY